MPKKILINLRESVSANLSHNLGLKIMAVLIAIFLWWTVVNIDDPIQSRKYYVEVSVTNPEVVTNEGNSFQVQEGSKTIQVTVKARRKVIEQISVNNISATADMRELQGASVPVRVSISGFEGQYESAQPYPQNIQVDVERTQEKTFPITPVASGNVRDGYVVAGLSVSPQSVDISGPESIVGKISKVVAKVDVTGLAADRKIPTTLVYYDAADNVIQQTHLSSQLDKTGVDVNVTVWETKVVDVVFDTSGIKAADGYLFNGIEYEPQTIKVAASSATLNTLEEIAIPAEALTREDMTESEKVVVDITEYLPVGVILADSDAASIAVEINLEQIGTKRFSIPVRSVKVTGLAENLQLDYGPEQSVAIVFSGRAEALETLTDGSFVASIDLTEYIDAGAFMVPVLISEQPDGCEYAGDAKISITLTLKEETNVEEENNTEM